MAHGGKREGAGRPKGSVVLSAELRTAAQEHTQEALEVIVGVLKSPHATIRLRAAEMMLARGHGAPREAPPSADIINRFISGEISAIAACLMLEAEGLKVPDIMRTYFKAEIQAHNFTPLSDLSFDEAPEPLPRS